jgi:hypothetical protein
LCQSPAWSRRRESVSKRIAGYVKKIVAFLAAVFAGYVLVFLKNI